MRLSKTRKAVNQVRILHIDETFHPAFGYQANPLAKFQQMQGNEVFIAAPVKEYIHSVYREFGDDGSNLDVQDAVYEQMTGVKIIRVPAKGRIMHRLIYGKEIFDLVDRVKPDVLFVHCVETLTAMRFILRRPDVPMMFDSHMLAMASRNKLAGLYESIYRKVFARIINKNGWFVLRTQDDDYVNKHLGINERLTPFVSFGTDTLLFRPSDEERARLREHYGISDSDCVVVYTGKLTPTKGGLFLAQAFEKRFASPVVLVCVGTPTDDDYGRMVKKTFDESENRIIMLPTQNYLDLAQYYQMSDLSVFPCQCSMSFYDAQACGLPVLSEDNNINVERCKHDNGMNFVQGDLQDFRNKVEMFASMSEMERRKMSDSARSYIENGYDYSDIAREYTEYLSETINKFNQRRH